MNTELLSALKPTSFMDFEHPEVEAFISGVVGNSENYSAC